jgi:hypothetical protein
VTDTRRFASSLCILLQHCSNKRPKTKASFYLTRNTLPRLNGSISHLGNDQPLSVAIVSSCTHITIFHLRTLAFCCRATTLLFNTSFRLQPSDATRTAPTEISLPPHYFSSPSHTLLIAGSFEISCRRHLHASSTTSPSIARMPPLLPSRSL